MLKVISLPSCLHVTALSIDQQLTFCDMLAHVSMKWCSNFEVAGHSGCSVADRCLYSVYYTRSCISASVRNLQSTGLFGGHRSGQISPVFSDKEAVLFHEHRVTSKPVISVI